jgi:hypothetical protein
MGRRKEDAIDVLAKSWGRQYRKIRGWEDRRMERATSREFIGAVRSTLGQRRDLHAGATSTGRIEQHFPEVFTGDALLVNNVVKAARHEIREALVLRYAYPAPPEVKASIMNVSIRTYWERVANAKHWLEGRLAV